MYMPILTLSRPPRLSPNLLDYVLHVRISKHARPQTRLVMACKFARTRPQSISPQSFDYSMQDPTIRESNIVCILARLRPFGSHTHGLQVYISTLNGSQPPSEPPDAVSHGPQVDPQTTTTVAYMLFGSFPPSLCAYSGDHNLSVHH